MMGFSFVMTYTKDDTGNPCGFPGILPLIKKSHGFFVGFSLPIKILQKIHEIKYPTHCPECCPDCDSVIYFIGPDICNVNYSSIDEAVSMIQQMGQGTLLLAKTDLKSAFRLLSIYPGDFDC